MDIEKKNQKLGKQNLESSKQFEKCMKKAAKSGLQSFEYHGESYEITRFGNCVQTLIDGRFLYRVMFNDTDNLNQNRSDIVNF